MDLQTANTWLNQIIKEAVDIVNKKFSPRRLAKLPRNVEPLPTDPRQLSSYRTRIGTMLEYALSTAIQEVLDAKYGGKYLITFATSHEYPDFYFRNDELVVLFRIEMKAVDAESDEQAARFSTPTAWINPDKDLLLLVGWEWAQILNSKNVIIGECPHIFASVLIPAGDVAKERDVRLLITDGKIDGEEVFVKNKDGDYVPDPGNYGKFWRLIHPSRRNSAILDETMNKFLEFLGEINAHSPRKRF